MTNVNDKENLENSLSNKELELITPIKLERVRKINGLYTVVPITIDEAISKSARRVKVLPNGKEILDTTYFEDRMKTLVRTEIKKKQNKSGIWQEENQPRIFEIIHEMCKKRKPQDTECKSDKRFRSTLNKG